MAIASSSGKRRTSVMTSSTSRCVGAARVSVAMNRWMTSSVKPGAVKIRPTARSVIASSPASSTISRRAHCSGVSPEFNVPAGASHR